MRSSRKRFFSFLRVEPHGFFALLFLLFAHLLPVFPLSRCFYQLSCAHPPTPGGFRSRSAVQLFNNLVAQVVGISKDKQTTENQRFEILKFADEKRLQIDEWVDETVTGVKKARLRKLGPLLERMKAGDVLIVSEISRLGRSLMEVMSILD